MLNTTIDSPHNSPNAANANINPKLILNATLSFTALFRLMPFTYPCNRSTGMKLYPFLAAYYFSHNG
jgi:hypothetical protein